MENKNPLKATELKKLGRGFKMAIRGTKQRV
jgi:hypothetical protein